MSREYPLGHSEKKLYDISKEVKLHQARLRFLALEEENAQIAKRRAKNRLQLVGRLPDEVITSILSFALKDCGALIWRSPVFAVSHRWRNCALSEPTIWQLIKIVVDTQKDELITWLARSRNAPLFVDYSLDYANSKSPKEHFTMIQTLIAPHADRIHDSSYNVGFATDFLFPLTMTPPSLKVLSVSWRKTASSTSLFHVFGERAPPGLRRISLHMGFGSSAQVVLNDFDASALVTLEIDNAVTDHSIWSTLSRSHLLENLRWQAHARTRLERVANLPTGRPDQTTVNLEHLRSLSLSGPRTVSTLEHLDAPSLERLNIAFLPANSREGLITAILHRDQLQRLSLCHIGPLQKKQLLDIFTALPYLEYFIHDDWTAESIPALEILTPPAKVKLRNEMGSWCAPRLRVLCIQDNLPPMDVDPEILVRRGFAHAMSEYIHPLLSRRRAYASQPLMVVLKHTKLLDGFLGVEGIEWNDGAFDYQWLVD